MSTLDQSMQMVRGLAGIMKNRLTVEKAKAIVGARLAVRDRLFLQVMRESIWQNPRSPFHHLLAWAGWTDELLADSIGKRGLEATLASLRDSGVFLTHPEFKERKPIQRGGRALEWSELSADNPMVKPTFEVRTGGTRSRGTRVPATFTYLADQRGPTWCLTMEAIGAGSCPALIWIPRNAGFLWWLALAHMHRPVLGWFSTTDLSIVREPRLHRLMYRMGQAIGLTHGVRLPSLEYVPLTDAAVVLHAVLAARERYGACMVATSPSGATRMAGLATSRTPGR